MEQMTDKRPSLVYKEFWKIDKGTIQKDMDKKVYIDIS